MRANHGRRVRSWIEGSRIDDGDVSEQIRAILTPLIEDLNPTFVKDLAKVCESHTHDALDDQKLFPVSQPYGSDQETANVQYVALVLRTVDLLHIRDRTPSIVYQLINPSDPYSQIEWSKQQRVRSVRAKPARNKDGDIDDSVQSETIEVHAEFDDPDGFFGLTSSAICGGSTTAIPLYCEKIRER